MNRNWLNRLKTAVRDASLRRKMVLAVEVNCLLGVLIASFSLFAYQAYSLRKQFGTEITALTKMVATYSVAPVSFEDTKGMTDLLDGLRVRPEVTAAELRSPEGKLLASYGAAPAAAAPEAASLGFHGWQLRVSEPLILRGESLGTLVLTSSFRPVFGSAVRNFAPFLALALVASLVGVVLLTRFAARVLLSGLGRLGESAGRIASTADYSIRAPAGSRDEVGRLTDTFNKMLDELQAADSKLRSTNASLATEIAERKRLEKALVASSRVAGMAEVATGVLHNVGNVLNSVNVSAHLVRDRLEASELKNLDRAVGLYRPHIDNPGPFFSSDPRGPLVLKFIAELSSQLETERQGFLGEIQSLSRNVEHIKEVVSTQQSYARHAGVNETLEAQELMEDAIRINHASLDRHGVQIEFAASEPITMETDRHQVLQILVNLISNGIHALDVHPAGRRTLRLSILRRDDSAEIQVSDDGVGIAAENLTRIFQHGFTTRKDGHGFGLHSGAIAARNIGGKLEASSEGLGRGATFTLTIPLQPKAGTSAATRSPFAAIP